eukprot:CAMPEP_0168588204 /NCGR_PEP_ID=MMETSP0420-20121227/5311_1 /TAXON_ID=498008 /ORGANISM="Pessonella sp." /LENGTH=62 /DNA_ID=CAMNT_0008623583 /DNA_START=226 /DNA_END=411 /DNA_ORIENTATION=+
MEVIKDLRGDVWRAVIINGLLGLVFSGFSEVFPLWTKSTPKDYGLGFDAFEIGIAHAISGPC